MSNPQIRFKNDTNSWKKSTLGEIGNVKQGFPFSSNNYSTSGIFNIITISNVQGNKYITVSETTNKIISIPKNIQKHQILKQDDILIALTGNVGRVSMNNGTNNLLNQRVGLFVVNCAYKDYIYIILSSDLFETKMMESAQGAAQLNISNNDIEYYRIYLPKLQIQKQIASFFLSITNKINNEQQTIDKLKKVKTAMLKLMFSQDNSTYPRLRFNGYTDAWEQQYINANLFPKIKKYPTTAYYY